MDALDLYVEHRFERKLDPALRFHECSQPCLVVPLDGPPAGFEVLVVDVGGEFGELREVGHPAIPDLFVDQRG